MFDLCSSDTIFEEKYREIYEKREKKVYRVAAPYKNVTYNNNDAVDACMCVLVCKNSKSRVYDTHSYSWLRLYREQNVVSCSLHTDTIISGLLLFGQCGQVITSLKN